VGEATNTSGLAGKTLQATLETVSIATDTGLDDFLNGSSLSATVRFGGLRAGWASFSIRGLRLHGYSYVPGVQISGTLDTRDFRSTLVVSGSKAAAGTIVYDTKTKTISGDLGGVFVSSPTNHIAHSATAALASAASAPARSLALALGGL